MPSVTGRCLQANTERHADLDLAGGQHLDEVGGRELAALIRLAERAGQKIVLQRQFPDLGMQGLHVDHRFRLGLRPITEHPGRTLKKLIAPLLDLVGLSHMLRMCCR